MNTTGRIKYVFYTLSAIIVCIFFLVSEVCAQEEKVRKNLSVLPAEVYPKMITLIPNEEWEKVDECFQSIKPLFRYVDQEFSTDYTIQLDSSIKNKNKKSALHLLTKVAFYCIIDHLDNAIKMETRSEVAIMTRVSFSEFLSIESQIKKEHFNKCQQVIMQFRRSYSYSYDAKKFERSSGDLIKNLKYLADNLVAG